MAKKTRCIIIGLGGISLHEMPFLLKKEWYETAAIVDVRDESLAKARSLLSLPNSSLFKDLDEAYDKAEADVAIINTPSELHYGQAKAALEAGLNVLVAKPITNKYEEAVELVELAQEKKLNLSVNQQVRYNRHYQAVTRFVASGKLGHVEFVNFLNTKPRHKALNLKDIDQPAMYEMACHHFDSLMAILPGRDPERISCDGFLPSWSVYTGPCMVNGLIELSGGLHVLYHGGFSSQANCYELRLEGSKGVLRCRGLHMSKDTMTYEFAERGKGFEVSQEVDADIPAKNPMIPFFDIWHEYLLGGPEPPFSGRNNLKVFALLSAGIDSIVSRQPVKVADNPRYSSAFEG